MFLVIVRKSMFKEKDLRALWRWVQSKSPRAHPVERYQEEFPASGRAFLRFIRQCSLEKVEPAGQPLGVVVMPWVSTPAPWFSLALAVGLARRGKKIALVWDDSALGLPLDAPERLRVQDVHIARALEALGDVFPIARLSEQPPQPARERDANALQELSDLNLTWGLRGALPSEEVRRAFPLAPENLARTLALVRGLLQSARYESLLVIGGIYGTSGLFRLAGEEAGIRVATFDGTFGVVQICVDGIAAQQSDIPIAFRELERAAPEILDWARGQAQEAFQRRVEARDEAAYQVVPPQQDGAAPSADVVIPMNVEWDAAALGRHTVFENTADWITATVEFVLSRSAQTIAVRQHPAERKKFDRSRFDIGAILQERFGENPRLRVVAADEPINTYDLIQSATVVLPFASTIGIEAAAMGKVVLVSGASCYSSLDFVWKASSREEYLNLLGRALRGELPRKAHQIEKAWLCYYLTPVCNRVWTDFTSAPGDSDFWKWVGRDPEALFADAAVADMLTALVENRPLSLIRHERKVPEGLCAAKAETISYEEAQAAGD
jgi:capsular polysaccharide biosynthesis protein